MALVLGSFFVGITFLANHYGVTPTEGETVVSQLARHIFGRGFFYYLVQATTAVVLGIIATTKFTHGAGVVMVLLPARQPTCARSGKSGEMMWH